MEKKFVSLWFPFLVTDWICIRQPGYRDNPLVVCSPSHGRLIISAADNIAAAKGVFKGMSLADARAIVPSLNIVAERPGLIENILRRIGEWCIRFTPIVSMDPPAGLILDVSGCTHLWNGDDAYIKELGSRLEAYGYKIGIALAPTPGAAWACARFHGQKKVISPSDLLSSILPLPPESLRVDEETAAMLHKLGLTRLHDFITMPASVLLNRFGKTINQRIEQMLGKTEEIVQPLFPLENEQQRLPTPELILTRTGIEIALQRTLKALCECLRKTNSGIRRCVFKIYKYDGKMQEISINTHQASCNFPHLFKLFEIRISDLDPGPGIELFILECTQAERNIPSQEKIWEVAAGLNADKISELLDKISVRLGENSIARYLPAEHHWPERSYRPARGLDERISIVWRKIPRPLELLTHPIPIEVAAPIPDYPPMLFRHKGKLHRIKKADGPERIEREWWLEEGEHRDYYALEDEEGRRYWVYRSGPYSESRSWQWFLCGYFA